MDGNGPIQIHEPEEMTTPEMSVQTPPAETTTVAEPPSLTEEELEEIHLLNLAEKFRSAKALLVSGGPMGVTTISLSAKELGLAINGLRALRDEIPQSPEDLSAKILSERRDMLRQLRPATLKASEA